MLGFIVTESVGSGVTNSVLWWGNKGAVGCPYKAIESFQSLIICFTQTYHDRQLCLPSGATKLKHQLVKQNVNLPSKFGYKRRSGNIGY